MLSVPRIVLFKAPSPEHEAILAALKGHDFSIRIANQADEAQQLLKEEQEDFDAFLLPSQLASGKTSSATCLELRANPQLSDTPIVALCASNDKSSIQALYEIGADVVFVGPWDADLLHWQIGALSRRRETLSTRSSLLEQHQLKLSTFSAAFNLIRDGILIVNTQQELIACNQAARSMLGFSEELQAAQWRKLLPSLSAQLKNHEQETRKQIGLLKPQRQSTSLNTALNRSDGQIFQGEIEIFSVFDDQGRIIAMVLQLLESAQFRQLSANLFQGERARALALMTSAACISLVAPQVSSERSALSATSKALEAHPQKTCSINQVLTALLEFLDLVMSPAISVRVNVERDLQLAVKSQDLVQMLGQVILHASQFIGSEGEILIESGKHVPGEGVTLLVAAQSKKPLPFVSDQRLAALINMDLTRFIGVKQAELAQASGLLAAQKTAQLYRSNIEYQHPTESSLKIRLRLPAA